MDVENKVESLAISYEDIRRQKILENQKLLEELGLTKGGGGQDGLTSALLMDLPPPPKNFPATKRAAPKYSASRANKKAALAASPGRSSRRLRGEMPDETVDLDELLDQQDRIQQSASRSKLDDLRRMNEEKEYLVDMEITPPFTLASIGTTVWDLGKIYTGEQRSKYWSTHGCKFKHPYPIGYRATKSHFGNQYTMTITEGENGPLFSVQVNASHTFTGATPTAPWTTACIKSKSPSTRVSGPLFYGFSDLITMRLIEELEDYDKAADPASTTEKPARSSRRLERQSTEKS